MVKIKLNQFFKIIKPLTEYAFVEWDERWIHNMRKMVLSLLVDNTSGVLSRVSGMFSRRGYNIDSLSVGVTENPQYSKSGAKRS